MKEIPLTQGKVAIVSDEDYEWLVARGRWRADRCRKAFYAARGERDPETGKQRTVHMHRLIMDTPEGMDTDHVNGDTLDNRRENLRVVTCRQNLQNRHHEKSSRFPGVHWNKQRRKWKAQITIDGRHKHLGYFQTEEEAFSAYCAAVNELKEEILPEWREKLAQNRP